MVPEQLLPDEQAGAKHVGGHIAPGKAPFGREPVENLNGGKINQSPHSAIPDRLFLFHPAPAQAFVSNPAYPVGGGDMTGLVHQHPFTAIVEEMKGRPGIIGIP